MAAHCWFLLPLEVLLTYPFPLLTPSLVVLPAPRYVLDPVAVLASLHPPSPGGLSPILLPLTKKLFLPLEPSPLSRSPWSLRLGPLAKLPLLLDALRCALLAAFPGG